MIGCFDTKGLEFEYLRSCLMEENLEVISINAGVHSSDCHFPINFKNTDVASTANVDLEALREKSDRSITLDHMGRGAAKIIADLVSMGQVDGAIGMGGGGGTYLALLAMQSIPFGIPKLCLSTVATKDLSRQVGIKDITLIPSLVDIAGLNQINRKQIRQTAGALAGMIRAATPRSENKTGSIAISMFGNTTPCVEKCTVLLQDLGYEVMAFHAVGIGGQTMEALIRDGYFSGLLDLTTTEMADDLCGGICSAGPNRLTVAAEKGIPQVVGPGCLDMVNFGHPDTVPEIYKNRKMFQWAPDVTLMRTNKNENEQLGLTISQRLNLSNGKTAVLLPLLGISKISRPGEFFYDPEADQALFQAIRENINENIDIIEIDTHINDPVFAEAAVNKLLELMKK